MVSKRQLPQEETEEAVSDCSDVHPALEGGCCRRGAPPGGGAYTVA